jgi:hypothetical protein
VANEVEYKTMDRRLTARLLRKGFLSEREVEKSIKSLPDVADEAVPAEVTLDPAVGAGPRSR